MIALSQPGLQHQADLFLNNAALPEPQVVIIKIGYGPEGLNAGRVLFHQFLDDQGKSQATLALQKQATLTLEQMRRATRIELSDFKQTILVLYSDNPTVLTSLDIPSRQSHRTNPRPAAGNDAAEPNSTPHSHHAKSYVTLAEDIAHWKLMLANVSTLTAEQQAELARAGWTAERLAAALAMVEACAGADAIQQQRIHARLAQSAITKASEKALRKWYNQAARLCKLAIKQADPTNQLRLLELLGLQ